MWENDQGLLKEMCPWIKEYANNWDFKKYGFITYASSGNLEAVQKFYFFQYIIDIKKDLEIPLKNYKN